VVDGPGGQLDLLVLGGAVLSLLHHGRRGSVCGCFHRGHTLLPLFSLVLGLGFHVSCGGLTLSEEVAQSKVIEQLVERRHELLGDDRNLSVLPVLEAGLQKVNDGAEALRIDVQERQAAAVSQDLALPAAGEELRQVALRHGVAKDLAPDLERLAADVELRP